MSDDSLIRVLLVDDHEMVRQGLVFFLSIQADIRVVDQAANGLEAVQKAAQHRPDVILMDLVMPEMDGIEATRQIKMQYPAIEVLALTSYSDEERVTEAIEAGVAGYVMKDINPVELARAIRSAARGEMYLSPSAARFLARRIRSSTPVLLDPLTPRELEVLTRLARGLNNQDIAQDLVISPKTVKAHLGSIFQKLGVNSRTQAALYALQHNLVRLEE